MNDLIRPTLYEAYHEIIPVKQTDREDISIDVVGPICETGDVFGKNRKLPELQEGELVALRSCGAYGAVMSSEYNTRPLTQEVLVKDGQYSVVRKKETYENIIARDNIPAWLG